jgi:hypothetical protein
MTVELLESSANSMLKCLSARSLKELDKKAVTNLGNVMRTRKLPLFGAPGVNKTLEDMYF